MIVSLHVVSQVQSIDCGNPARCIDVHFARWRDEVLDHRDEYAGYDQPVR
jgi:hypothetical protein